MSPTLTSVDLARVEVANRALLSPLAAPDHQAWRAQVLEAFRDLLGVNRTLFALPTPAGPDFFSADMDEADRAVFGAWVDASTGTYRSTEPALDGWFAHRRGQRIPVFDDALMDHATGAAYTRSEFHHEVRATARMCDHTGIMIERPEGEVLLCLSYDRPGAAKPRWDRAAVLRALVPSLEAGLDALARFDAGRRALDAVTEPLLVCDTDGRECHRNAALVGLLAADPERERVEGALRLVVRSLRPLVGPRRLDGPASPDRPSREVLTARGRYTLRGTVLPPGAFGADASAIVSATLAVAAPPLPTSDVLHQQHGLTRREAEVALLLAEGLTNDGLAARLFISRHTARHHVEAVLLKLDVPTRAAVAGRLIRPAGVRSA